jgi:peptidoglycan hydrolase-like protein with peptidoglycan-binding domain
MLLLALAALALPADASAYEKLRRGDTGPKVRELQRALNVPADGVFGRATARAVCRFQRRHDLRPTGVVGRRMARMLGLDRESRHTPLASTGGNGGTAYGKAAGRPRPRGRGARKP